MALTAEQLERMFGFNEQNYTPQIIKFEVDGNVIECYANYSYFDAKSYNTEPVRSEAGVIVDLENYPTFLTPRLRIKFSMMPLETYRIIMKLIQMRNEHTVTCYDIVWDKMRTFKAYFSTEDYPELFVYDLHTLGAIGYEIELQGTNDDEEDVFTVQYNSNTSRYGISYDKVVSVEEIARGTGIVIGHDFELDNEFGSAFEYWDFDKWTDNADGTGMVYLDGGEYFIHSNITLYAQWKRSSRKI